MPGSSLVSDGTETAHGGLRTERALAEKVSQCEEENRQACEKERRKMGGCWVDIDGDQLMDVEEEIADTLSESGSDDDTGEIKALKV